MPRIILVFVSLILFLPSLVFGHAPNKPGPEPPPGDPCPPECCPKSPAGGSGSPNPPPAPDSPIGAPVWAVNPVGFNLFVTDVPLTYSPALGPRITAQVSYNSVLASQDIEPFGKKWTFSYGGYVQKDSLDNVYLTLSDGGQLQFNPDGAGGYIQSCSCDSYMELTQHDIETFILSTISETTYTYKKLVGADSRFYLTTITDPHGLTITLSYYGNQLRRITDPLGQVTHLHYNDEDLVGRIEGPFGREVFFTYDGERNLTSITDAVGYTTTFEYSPDSMLSAIINTGGRTDFYFEQPSGNNSWVEYPAPDTDLGNSSRLTITHPNESKEEWYYNGVNGTAWHVSPEHYKEYTDSPNNFSSEVAKTIYTYANTVRGVRADIASIASSNGEKRVYTYNDNGRVVAVADAAGNTRRKTYSDKGRITSRQKPSGHITTYTYDDMEQNLLQVTDSLGTMTMTYDDKHKLLTVTGKDDKVTSYTYNTYGQLTTITDPLQVVTSLTYNAQHQLSQVLRAGQVLTSLSYDTMGRVQSSTDATGLTRTYSYDNLDHLLSITYPDGKQERWEYNSVHSPNLLTKAIARSGLAQSYGYDRSKNLVSFIDTDMSRQEGTYSQDGHLLSFIDPQDNNTAFSYDTIGRITGKTYADGSSLAYTYYSTGQVQTMTNARGQVSTYYYNANGQLLSIDYQDPDTPDISVTYDEHERLSTITDGLGTTTFTYDAGSQVATVDGPWDNDTITYTYNDGYQLVGLAIDQGQSQTYTLDDLGRMTGIQVGANAYTYDYVTSSSPLIQSLTRPNGTRTVYTYDTLNRLLSLENQDSTGGPITSYGYTYNSQDLRGSESITGTLPAPSLTDQVTQSTFNNVNQLLSSISPDASFTYDLDGNMLTGQTPEGYDFTASYDQENRLVGITYTDSASVVHRIKYTYGFDHFIGRIEKFADEVLVSDTRLIRNGNLVIQERDATNTVTREYIWGLNLGGGIGGLLQLQQDGDKYSFLYDGSGNVTSVLDNAGSQVAQYRYNAFGKLVAQAGSLDQPFQFSTKRYDPQTGLSYYGYRFYNPQIERWMNRDPLGEEGGINLYGFVGQNPVNWVDPWGENISATIGVSIGGSIGGPVGAVIGGAIGLGVGLYGGQQLWNWMMNEGEERLPTGSKPIDKTPWSGDHGEIKDGIGNGPADDTWISPDDHVWSQNPDGTYNDHGPACDYTGSGKPSGRKGKNRKKSWK